MADPNPDTQSPTAPDDRYGVIRVPPGAGERVTLLGPYVEMVWSELLGPTATLVARRIGYALERPDHRRELSLTVIGNSLGVAPSKVRWSLTRLASFELITISSSPDAVVTSGYVTPVPTRLLAKLSPAGLLEHRELLGSSAGRRLSKVWPSESSGPAMRRPNGRAL
jgi:hypothetical protein